MSEFPGCLLIVTAEVDPAVDAEWNRWSLSLPVDAEPSDPGAPRELRAPVPHSTLDVSARSSPTEAAEGVGKRGGRPPCPLRQRAVAVAMVVALAGCGATPPLPQKTEVGQPASQ